MFIAVLTTSISACVLGWLALFLWRRRRRVLQGARLPPMPPASSIFGHVELHQRDFHRTKAIEWASKYGSIFRLRINFTDVVVMNDIESIRKFVNHNELLYRADCFLTPLSPNQGLGVLNGAEWKANKKFCMSMLRDLGFNETSLERRMMKEYCKLADRIDEANGNPVFIFSDILAAASNNIASFFYASNQPEEEAWRKDMNRFLSMINAVMIKAGVFQFLPRFVRRIFQYIPFTVAGKVRAIMGELEDTIMKQNQKFLTEGSKESEGNFIQAYMKKIDEAKHDAKAVFQYRFLVGNITAFIMAGTFNTTITLLFHLLNFAAHRDTIQARVQKEIDEVIGSQRLPTWQDRKDMPFTLACVWEMDRWQTAAPVGLPRVAGDDIVVDGLFIPKGTVVLFNIWAVHNNPACWDEPQLFKPSRFLNEDGSIMDRKPPELIPFSLGRRSCPGEMFASIETFLLITLLLQRYDVVLDQPLKGDLSDPNSAFVLLGQTKLRFLPRNVNKV
ncbi:cytochrome P450 2U1-like [Amblyomma americanum]